MKILISVMFNENESSYALQGNNIVHETINLLKADDGKHYIYIAPSGIVQKCAQKGDQKINELLLVRAFSKGTVQVIARAEEPDYKKDDISALVKYGNQNLNKIFTNNTSNGEHYISFEVEKLYQPTKLILITTGDKEIFDSDKVATSKIDARVRNQSLRLYLSGNDTDDDSDDYKKIKALIDDSTLWKPAEYKTIAETEIPKVKPTFMDIIGKADNELAFSNLFAFFFSKYKDIFREFLKFNSKKTSFDVNDFKIEHLSMEREKNHIDIYATDGTWHIIIENKIKSGINGVEKDKSDNGRIKSQLNKYIEALTNADEDEEKIICFLLHPQYMQFNLDCFEKGDEYNKVSYKDLYGLFVQHEAIIEEEDQLFFKLMLDALRKHTKERDTDIEERMINRFIQQIKEPNSK